MSTIPPLFGMDSSTLCNLLLLSLLASAAAESTPSFSPSNSNSKTFRPSVVVVIGIFAVMFTLTILLLLYAKLCHTHARSLFRPHFTARPLAPGGASKTVIESLPFFLFASLKGSRDGLECAVCLSAFDDADLLRLLPKCKHAFHIDCVDRWLEHRASCPLCRCFVDASDCPSNSEGVIEQLELELFVERVPSGRRSGSSSSRFGNFLKIGALLADDSGAESQHRFKHRIFASEVVMKSRWSDVNSADLLSLNSEMLGVLASKRFDPIRGTETDGIVESDIGRDYSVVSVSESDGGGDLRSLMAAPGKRCMSEMASLPRFRVSGSRMGDETVRTAWLPIARRTLKWFTGVDRRLLEQ